jgi:two-component system, OmpR family, response regulator
MAPIDCLRSTIARQTPESNLLVPRLRTGSVSTANNQSARILIVEDDPIMKQMVGDYLEQHNMRVVSASGRQEMVQHFAAGEPDLVILDLRLGQE